VFAVHPDAFSLKRKQKLKNYFNDSSNSGNYYSLTLIGDFALQWLPLNGITDNVIDCIMLSV